MDGRVKPGHDELVKDVAKARGVKTGDIGRVSVIPDFLPAPADLVPRE